MKTVAIFCLAIAGLTGCVATKSIVLDRNADWVKLGPDVYGSYYLRVKGEWVLQKSKLHFPHGWISGPEPK